MFSCYNCGCGLTSPSEIVYEVVPESYEPLMENRIETTQDNIPLYNASINLDSNKSIAVRYMSSTSTLDDPKTTHLLTRSTSINFDGAPLENWSPGKVNEEDPLPLAIVSCSVQNCTSQRIVIGTCTLKICCCVGGCGRAFCKEHDGASLMH